MVERRSHNYIAKKAGEIRVKENQERDGPVMKKRMGVIRKDMKACRVHKNIVREGRRERYK